MTIETRFNKGEQVFVIHDSTIIRIPIKDVVYGNGKIHYILIKTKAVQLIDKDVEIAVAESDCFANLEALKLHFDNIFK